MPKKKSLQILVVGLVTLTVGVLVIQFIWNKPHTNVAKTDANIRLSCQALINDFETNEAEANTKYLDQIIEVSGQIAHVTQVKENLVVSLGEKALFGNVKCHLTPAETKKYEQLKKGQPITIKGVCTGYLMDVILVNAVVVNQ